MCLLLALLRKILVENPSQRATVTAIRRHQWFTAVYSKDTGESALQISADLFCFIICQFICNE